MRVFPHWRGPLVVAAVLLLAFAGTALAQQQTGNIHGTVVDTATGEALPGVVVTLSGMGPTLTQVTGPQGQYRFLGLAPGNYRIEAMLEGFSPVVFEAANVRVGQNTAIELRMNPAIEETITVTAESPLLDERRVATGATVTQVELEKIPTARDPWSVLQSVPGVLTDRVNVGGIEAGEQSNFVSGGASRLDADWAIDGVKVTDPAARGASPTYFDFENMAEMQFSTGGTEIGARTSGTQVNLVTRRGTNEWRGSARFFRSDDRWQDSPDVSSGKLGQAGPWNQGNAQGALTKATQIDAVDEYGIELGGPLVRDQLFFWGSYGVVDVTKFAIGAGQTLIPDDTELENWAGKINWQATPSTSAVGFYHYGDKLKFGRNAGPTRPAPTTWNQTGPTSIYKLEATQIFGANVFLTGLVSYVDGGFQLTPQGGFGPGDPNMVLDLTVGHWRHTFLHFETERPQRQATVDGHYFFQTGDWSHELRFGVGYRKSEVDSLIATPGDGVLGILFEPGDGLAIIRQDHIWSDEFEQWDLFAQNTFSRDRLTLNVGLRFDRQDPQNNAVTVPASRFLGPDGQPVLEAMTRPAADPGFKWDNISPRLGVTYALGEERRTLVRASYSEFVEQMGSGHFSDLGPNLWYRYAYAWWYDDGDAVVQPGELEVFAVLPPRDLTFSANSVDSGLDAPLTREGILGAEHSVLPELVLGAHLTWRRVKDMLQNYPFVIDTATGERRIHRRDDYVIVDHLVGTLPTGQTFREPFWALRDGIVLDPARGVHLDNSDIGQDYLGLTLSFTKRLSNRWMARGHFTWMDWTWDYPQRERIDPNRFVNTQDGSQVLQQSLGSGNRGEVWLNSRWSANLAGMYQVAPDQPWGFNLAADIFGRQGFAQPHRVPMTTGLGRSPDGISRSILLAPSNTSSRMDDVYSVNLRVEKPFSFGDWGLTAGLDLFNVFNNNVELQRENEVSAIRESDGAEFNHVRSDHIRETMSPRIVRVSLRATLR